LVFPSDSFSYTDLGISTTGARVRLFTIDPRQLDRDLRELLKCISLENASEELTVSV
jgi:hypothetical protein